MADEERQIGPSGRSSFANGAKHTMTLGRSPLHERSFLWRADSHEVAKSAALQEWRQVLQQLQEWDEKAGQLTRTRVIRMHN